MAAVPRVRDSLGDSWGYLLLFDKCELWKPLPCSAEAPAMFILQYDSHCLPKGELSKMGMYRKSLYCHLRPVTFRVILGDFSVKHSDTSIILVTESI